MDTTRFDQIASTFAQTHNRRGAFRFLAAAALGVGSLTLLAPDEGQARKRGKKKGGKDKGDKGTPAPSGSTGTGGSVRT